MPPWYFYRKSDIIPDLVIIATPGYAVYTEDERKQIPRPSETIRHTGLSGYNNEYPDMLGLFLAFGPCGQSSRRMLHINSYTSTKFAGPFRIPDRNTETFESIKIGI
uniref:Ectonucleotide pyrophosphatase/phosphodiesterase family member 3 n=1 Tax=Ascaris lumbricoides TaxID=6252 RepID=A0A0M3IBY0_ASCLU